MSINRVQFQKGLSLGEFMMHYGTEEQCLATLAQSRWRDGFVCSSCQDARHSTFVHDGYQHFQFRRCRHQMTVTSGTIFADTQLPLRLWFLVMHLLTQAKNNASALELMSHLGVGYRSALRIQHKLMTVMDLRERCRVQSGHVKIDDAYLGGEHLGNVGRGLESKIPFVAAVQTMERGRSLYLRLAPLRFTVGDLGRWARGVLAPDTHLVSDGLHGFRATGNGMVCYERHIVGSGRKAVEHPAFMAFNPVLGNLKIAVNGTYHAFDFIRYGHRYLAEVACRFNHRFDLSAILRCLLGAAALTASWPEPQLRSVEIRD